MVVLGKTLWAVNVWLTAIMTLIVGFPHFYCRCPSGEIKPFCLGQVSGKSGCCCSGTCCASERGGASCCRAEAKRSADRPDGASCCAQHPHRQSREAPRAGTQMSHEGCTKTIAQAEVFVTLDTKPASGRDLGPSQPLLTPVGRTFRSATAAFGTIPWQIHLVAPPMDLVIALQHFLI